MKSLGRFLASDFGPRNRPLWNGVRSQGRNDVCLALSAEAAYHGDGRTRTIGVTCGACAARLRGSAPRRCPCGAVARRGACARRAYRRRVAARRTPQPGAPAVSELGAALSLMHPTRQSDALSIGHPWKTLYGVLYGTYFTVGILHTRNNDSAVRFSVWAKSVGGTAVTTAARVVPAGICVVASVF